MLRRGVSRVRGLKIEAGRRVPHQPVGQIFFGMIALWFFWDDLKMITG